MAANWCGIVGWENYLAGGTICICMQITSPIVPANSSLAVAISMAVKVTILKLAPSFAVRVLAVKPGG